MNITHLFNENWHTDPEQQSMDATRRARQGREREPAGSSAIDARLAANNNARQQYAETGHFWLKQKDTQQHINDQPYVGKAAANAAALELLKQQPELRGNLVVTAYGPGEQQVTEGRVKELGQDLKDKAMSDDDFKKKYSKTRAEVRAAMREKSVAEGQTPEQEIDRLKLRQNAEHGGASLKRQSATQARIRELEKQIKDKKGVAEGSLEEVSQNTLKSYVKQAKRDVKSVDDAGIYNDTDLDILRRREKGLDTAKNKLKKIKQQGVAEMDKSQPSHGRDGKISHSTYGSRDKGGSTGQERTAKMTTADRMMKDAHDVMMRSMSDADKVKKGWRNPNMKEGSEQMVGFHLDSERAYEAVMAKFGHVIDHDEDSGTMYVPERLWPTVEATAYDADGIGAQRDDELENPEHYGVDEAQYDSGDYYNARIGAEYGRDLNPTGNGGAGEGTKRDDIFKGQSKQLPADPFGRTSGAVPRSKTGQMHHIALPDEMDEGEKVGNMDADRFDDAMARLKKLAGAGPMRTVYDPAKRVYRNVPTAQQPGDKK